MVKALVLALFFTFYLSPPAHAGHGKPVSPCKINHPSDNTLSWKCRLIKPGVNLETLFGDRWEDLLRFNRIDRRHVQKGAYLKVPDDLDRIAGFSPLPPEYPAGENEPKLILLDLAEQYLGAYENGHLVFSMPAATGGPANETPEGTFRIDAVHRVRDSSLYTIEKTDIPYPMRWALRFFIDREGVSYWIHGRDLPGYPGSHGCVGLYDEAMQKEFYGNPKEPRLLDAKMLYDWVIGSLPEEERIKQVLDPFPGGPPLIVTGKARLAGSKRIMK